MQLCCSTHGNNIEAVTHGPAQRSASGVVRAVQETAAKLADRHRRA
jgi:hypothetical protein